MPVPPIASAMILWRGLNLGPLHFTPFGLAAAVGLIASMTLARRCAVRSGGDPDAIWDAGLFVIFSCFVASRLLLVLGSPGAFLKYPLLLLGLPSLSFDGMALAGLASLIYLRRKHLPVLPTLDTFAAPAALLAGFLELGHWADGSDAGIPTFLPWGVGVAGARVTLRVHPVALYGVVLSMALAVWLWTALPQARILNHRHPAEQERARAANVQTDGTVTSLALMSGGLIAFVLDMLSAPPALMPGSWLEPGQWTALIAMLTGSLVWALRPLGSAHATLRQHAPHPTPSPLHMEVH